MFAAVYMYYMQIMMRLNKTLKIKSKSVSAQYVA